MNKQRIKELALANGFKLKEQSDGSVDLNPYVYEFALVLMAEAGRAGYIQALKDFAPVIEDFSESDFKAADIYAAKVREGGE